MTIADGRCETTSVSQSQADGSCEITSVSKTQSDESYGMGGWGVRVALTSVSRNGPMKVS
jgi:hypothetical protein